MALRCSSRGFLRSWPNGAVSNVALTPHAVFILRRELRDGSYDVAHIHEPVVPVVGWDALLSDLSLRIAGVLLWTISC